MKKIIAFLLIALLFLGGCAADNGASLGRTLQYRRARRLVEEKLEDRFNDLLTEKEREAFEICLTHDSYMYLEGQCQGFIGGMKGQSPEQLTLQVTLFVPRDQAGCDLYAEHPLEASQYAVTKVDEAAVVVNKALWERKGETCYYPRLLRKRIKGPSDYLEKVRFEEVLPDGQQRLQITFPQEVKSLSEQTVEALVKHFLSINAVTWMEFSYYVEEDHSDPTAIHRFWEKEAQMSFKEARAIAMEKVLCRFNEKLTDKERMALYQVIYTRTQQYKNASIDPYEINWKTSMEIYTVEEGCLLHPLEDYGGELNLYGTILDYDKENKPGLGNPHGNITLPDKKGTDHDLSEHFTTVHPEVEGIYYTNLYISNLKGMSQLTNPLAFGNIYHQLIRHYLSVDCVTWICFDNTYLSYDGLFIN